MLSSMPGLPMVVKYPSAQPWNSLRNEDACSHPLHFRAPHGENGIWGG